MKKLNGIYPYFTTKPNAPKALYTDAVLLKGYLENWAINLRLGYTHVVGYVNVGETTSGVGGEYHKDAKKAEASRQDMLNRPQQYAAVGKVFPIEVLIAHYTKVN